MQPVTQIRPIADDDIAAFCDLAATTYVDAYSQQISAADLQQFIAQQFSPDVVRNSMQFADIQMLIVDQRPAGYFWLQPAVIPVDGHNVANGTELVRLYLLGDMRGRGYGRQMMRHCESSAQNAGHDAMWLKVWDQNPNAVSFYKSSGFALVGECPFQCGSLLCNDLVMLKRLSENAG